MYTFITVLIIIVCVLLVLVVLVQNSKGGGLASNFSSSNQIMGVRKTADFLEKATWTLAIALLVLSLMAGLMASSPKKGNGNPIGNESLLQEKLEETTDEGTALDYQTSQGQTEEDIDLQ